jgi:hypothetical protein
MLAGAVGSGRILNMPIIHFQRKICFRSRRELEGNYIGEEDCGI